MGQQEAAAADQMDADRSESFLADAHGRDHINKVRMALDKDNRITGLRVDSVANIGSYLSAFSVVTPTILHAPLLSGCYKIPAIYTNVKGMATTTAPVDAYRGAGRPEATYLLERVMDKAARQVGMDPAEFRRMNSSRRTPSRTRRRWRCNMTSAITSRRWTRRWT